MGKGRFGIHRDAIGAPKFGTATAGGESANATGITDASPASSVHEYGYATLGKQVKGTSSSGTSRSLARFAETWTLVSRPDSKRSVNLGEGRVTKKTGGGGGVYVNRRPTLLCLEVDGVPASSTTGVLLRTRYRSRKAGN